MTSSSSSSAASLPDRPGSGPGCFRYWAGWLHICFSAVSSLKTRPAAFDALGCLDQRHRLLNHCLVESDLLGGERHDAIGLDLWWQLWGDGWVGLLAPQQEWSHHRREPGGRQRVAVPFDRDRDPAGERLEVAEQSRRRPVHDRPQLREPVLHWGAGQGDAGRSLQLPQVPGGARQRVLGMLRLVGDDKSPVDIS
jgi:hypothetical protein